MLRRIAIGRYFHPGLFIQKKPMQQVQHYYNNNYCNISKEKGSFKI